MRILVWFRSDLRVRDNAALLAACARADDGVVGLFVLSPEEWKSHDVAPIRVGYMLRVLNELGKALAERGVPLRVVTSAKAAGVPRAVLREATAYGCDAVYFNYEYEVDESRRDAVLSRQAKAGRIGVQGFHDQVILEPGLLRSASDMPYRVFTPFHNAWLKHDLLIERLESRGLPRRQHTQGVRPSPIPTRVPGFDPPAFLSDWLAGEHAAARRLERFIESGIRDYHDRRDRPDIEGTSRLSPDLAIGCISPRLCLVKAWTDHSKPPANGVRSWLNEIVWREFYVHILAAFPRVCMGRAFMPATERVKWRTNKDHERAWREGRTGIPIVDAGMRQLATTGWMHNRVRMITAMFFSKNLLFNWRRGESWFMQNLIDGFFASNNGGWQWAASTGTDAAPYFRVFNPVSQSRRFDPHGDYIRRYLPELAHLDEKRIHEPWKDKAVSADRYPVPIVDLASSRRRAIQAFQAIRT